MSPLDATGNYPQPADGSCPSWFKDSLGWVGTAFRNRREVTNPDYIAVFNVDGTPHSKPPYCGHATEGGTIPVNKCEQLKACQDPMGADFYISLAGHFLNDRCDLASPDVGGDGYWCHHKAKKSEAGPTAFCAVAIGARPPADPFHDPHCVVVDVK